MISGDGRSAGKIMVLQMLVAQLIARDPLAVEILERLRDFPNGLEIGPDSNVAVGPEEREATAQYLADVKAGAEDCLRAMGAVVVAISARTE